MKPVAWRGERHDGSWLYADTKEELRIYTLKGFDMIPLYTAPRELSDEEILQIAFERNARIPNNIGNDMLLISFAKAILKKASEKC
jgi:hypothetical protein